MIGPMMARATAYAQYFRVTEQLVYAYHRVDLMCAGPIDEYLTGVINFIKNYTPLFSSVKSNFSNLDAEQTESVDH